MWCPFAQRKEVSDSKYWPGNKGRLAVVLHISGGSYESLINWFLGDSPTSAHLGISPQGDIVQFVGARHSAWANGASWDGRNWRDPSGHIIRPTWRRMQTVHTNPNWLTISIEHAGFPSNHWTPAMADANTRLLVWLGQQFPGLLPYVPGVTLIGHKDISPIDKSFCPGPHVNYQAIADRANAALGMGGTTPTPGYTAASPLIGTPKATQQQAVSYITARPTGEYNKHDISTAIIPAYWRVCEQAGIDPVLAVAQCIHETGNLTSYWAARPRRNPAGIGVTGQPGMGVQFPTWDQDAVPAHVGRLLAYAKKDDDQTPQQAALTALALRWRGLPASYRGAAPTLAQLDGRWAVPGNGYGAKIATIAEQIRTRRI